MSSANLPDNISDRITGLKAQAGRLWQDEFTFVPIRHHSPGCSMALLTLLEEIKPKTILIEAPEDCEELIDDCLNCDTVPPVAMLSQHKHQDNLASAFYPFCEYSPEWQALRSAEKYGAQIGFIDIPWSTRQKGIENRQAENLLQESYFEHNRFLQALAKHLGCSDHQESWELMFEQRHLHELKSWRNYFEDIYSYCALAREGYSEEALEQSGDLQRELFMRQRIFTERHETPVVVITGGFHTPALVQGTSDKNLKKEKDRQNKIKKTRGDSNNQNWLIRYSFDQLDALNGYSAGMPSPAYFQLLWNNFKNQNPSPHQSTANSMLINIAMQNRQQKLTQFIGTSEVKNASSMLHGLSLMRGKAEPGRQELLDAITSCFVKQSIDEASNVLVDARKVMCGDSLGQVPASEKRPPILNEVIFWCEKLGLTFNSTLRKNLELDIYGNDKHRDISRFFYLMHWLDVDFCSHIAGPDFINSSNTALVKEHWDFSWTPIVEANLLKLQIQGGDLKSLAIQKLLDIDNEAKAEGLGFQAGQITGILIHACLMGLHKYTLEFVGILQQTIHSDESLSSLTRCALHLLNLQQSSRFLQSEELELDITALYRTCWSQILLLLDRFDEAPADKSGEKVQSLKLVDSLYRQNNPTGTTYTDIISRLATSPECTPQIRGCCGAILFLNGNFQLEHLQRELMQAMQQFQFKDMIIDYLKGLTSMARELLWRMPDLLQVVHDMILELPESKFLAMLPGLRELFTELAPMEIDKVSRKVAHLSGIDKLQVNETVNVLQHDQIMKLQDLEQQATVLFRNSPSGNWIIE